LFATILSCKYAVENDIAGDFVECGVWRGGNSIAAASIFKRYNVDKKIWLFDTFEGMTDPAEKDAEAYGAKLSAKECCRLYGPEWCCASLDDVRKNFSDLGLLTESVVFIQGDVLKTLESVTLPDELAVLRLDTDWYDSTKKELETFYSRLSTNGIMMIDDYGHWGGAKKAVDEFFAALRGRKPFFNNIDYTGRLAIKPL
jgi:Macrocin-O-methyltransferase (TylF).